MKAWLKRHWRTLTLAVGALVAIFVYTGRKKAATASTAIVELDREKGRTKAEVEEHRTEAEGKLKMAEASKKRMQRIRREAKKNGNEKLADTISRWY